MSCENNKNLRYLYIIVSKLFLKNERVNYYIRFTYVSNMSRKQRITLKEYKKVKQKSESKNRGFEMMRLQMPKKNNVPEKKIKDLESIWNGDDINKVRKAHINGEVESINICKSCPFKETYNWKKIQ